MQNLVVIEMGRPPTPLAVRFGSQGEWFRRALAPVATRVRVVRPAVGEPLPDAATIGAAIVTGSWSMVTDSLDWSVRVGRWLERVMSCRRPLLGVCYGHQLMADVCGGRVNDHPDGIELGRLDVKCTAAARNDPWLAGLPNRFAAFLTHRQSVLTVPTTARVLARSAHDAHQILRYSDTALSVQFHPEFTAPLLGACLQRSVQAGEAAALEPTPVPRQLLHRFVGLARDQGPRPEPWSARE